MICIFASGKRKTLFSGKHRKENLFSGPCEDDPPPVREGKIVSIEGEKVNGKWPHRTEAKVLCDYGETLSAGCISGKWNIPRCYL